MGTEKSGVISPTKSPSSKLPVAEENKVQPSPRLVDSGEVTKGNFLKKIDITFQFGKFKRFILFGTETHYKSCSHQSINRWFITDTNIRLYIEEYKIKCLRCLSSAIEVLSKSKDEDALNQKDEIISKMAEILIENVDNSPAGVIPYLLYRIYSHTLLRPVLPKVFSSVIRDSSELLLFIYYMKKAKGNHHCARRVLIDWYKIHSENPKLLKDLLLVKRRMSWKHRDVIVHWRLPVLETDGILRILLGLPHEPSKIPEDKRSLVQKLVQLRSIDDRSDWLEYVNSNDYIKEIGLDLCYNVKPRIYSVDVLKVLIQRLPLNEFIEHIPRMWQKYPWSSELTSALEDQLKNWKAKYPKEQRNKVNILSVFIVWKWLAFQEFLYYGDGKRLRDSGAIDSKYYPQSLARLEAHVGSILQDKDYKRPEEILFLLNIPGSEVDESGSNLQKKPANQELKRPFIVGSIAKPIHFIQFLLFIYPNHRVVYKDKHYKISGKTFLKVTEELNKMRQSTGGSSTSSKPKIRPFKYAVIITFDGTVDLSDESPVKQHQVEKIVISSIRDEDLTQNCQLKEKLVQRNILFIKGVDCNFLSLIEKHFHYDC